MSLEGFYSWLSGEAKYAIYIIGIVLILWCLYKRAWLFALGAVIGLGGLSVFIINPELFVTVGTWFTGLLGIGK